MMSTASAKLATSCQRIQSCRVIPIHVDQLLPLPPPDGRKRYKTSPVRREGMKEMMQPISTIAFTVTRFMIGHSPERA